MGAGHGHGTATGPASGRHVRRLVAALAVLVVFLVVEVVVALATGSLALLADAGHMATDVLGIGMALAAILAARRSVVTGPRTFGLHRAEVLAALANAVLLAAVSVWVLTEAVGRLAAPTAVDGLAVLLTAAAGLGANLVAFVLLRPGARESLNVRGAYLEVLADTLASVGVLTAGALTLAFGWTWVDPVVAVVIGVVILPRTWGLARQALRILIQAAPAHVDVDALRRDLADVPGVGDVHDVHVWTLTSGMEVGSVHLQVTAAGDPVAVLATAQRLLAERHGLTHVTVQVEPADARVQCPTPTW